MGKVANSHQMMTVTVEHFRQVSHCVRESLGLTYNEFLALIALYETRATLGASDLADYLLLQRKTTWNILLTLEDLGLVSKTVEENDHRTMRCALTVKGEGVAVRGAEIVARFLRERFLRNLQDEEFFKFMRDSSLESCDLVRGHHVDALSVQPDRKLYFGSSHLLLWRITIDEWKQAIRGLAPFSLVEYRALDVLEAEEVLTPSELSSLLRIPRSNATLVLQKLEGANLIHIEEDVDDGRQRIVTLTEAGTKKASTLRRAANEVTQAMHSPIKQNGSMVVDAWYMRMYLNLSAEQPYQFPHCNHFSAIAF